ncbi:beta-ketoacyl synthase N-terminal-like domain-containing protein [Amycolatopsis sp. YIM 10]|uniref:beta-ketoacyl synthase N-terminal-like domain-containing protein n=1 Tax=Amycolatopsis sp. YIM 10 TaxID=2653857 RepID=UPI00129088E6|nr:beta-ketoacyl synthase N-terminal-like domain-containing protein [Amycolatopsis sp. YIM 10]QFU90544.1 3-oxoacyl-[acyl-carrier-protein] synthase 2 [Amycolatopsis sp. YIM 10]
MPIGQPNRDDRLVISSWSAVSPYGMGAGALREGLRSGRSAVTTLDGQRWPGPLDRAGVVPGFDITEVLGRKGTRSMDRATALAVTTVGMLVGGHAIGDSDRTGLVLGTTTGSVQSIMDFTEDSLTRDRPYLVDPAQFPNTVMNRAAGQSAIWYGLRGPNTTLAGGALTGLLALAFVSRMHRSGHAELMLCGAVEEFSERRAWLDWHTGGRGTAGEGCVVFLMESAAGARRGGRAPAAEVLSTKFTAFSEPAQARRRLAGCVEGALAAAGVAAGELALVATSPAGGELGEAEAAALSDVAGDGVPKIRCDEAVGDTAAASAAFQLAAALCQAPAGGLALITSIAPAGTAGCAVVAVHRTGSGADA